MDTSNTTQQWTDRLKKPVTESWEKVSKLARHKAGEWVVFLKSWLSPPEFADQEQNRQARVFHYFLIVTTLVCDLLGIPLTFFIPDSKFVAAIFVAITFTTFCSLILLRRRQLLFSVGLFLGVTWLITTYAVVILDGELTSPIIGGYLVIILASALFLGRGASLAATLISIASITFLFFGGQVGWSAPLDFTPLEWRFFISQILIFTTGLILINIAVASIQSAMTRARTHENKLLSKNTQLQDVLTSLEERIAARTAEISQQKQYYEALLLNSPIAIISLDDKHLIQSCNPAFVQLFGYTQDEVYGSDIDDLINTPSSLAEATQLTKNVVAGETIKKTTRRQRKDGRLVDVEISGVPILVDGRQIGSLALYQDISERLQVEEHLKYLATHDPLTVLPNRSLFYDHLRRSLQIAKHNQSHLAVFFIDLDGFKYVNDLFGHARGDELLQEVATRFRRTLRGSDLVARLGGDEFAFVCVDIHGEGDAALIANKILNTLSTPFNLDNNMITIHGSIGISLYPEDGDEAHSLLKYADSAMYLVKRQGKNHYQFYSSK